MTVNFQFLVIGVGPRIFTFFHRRQNTRREDGTIWEFGYNDRSEVTGAVKQAANSQLVPGQSFAYGFDAMGNRTSSSAGTAPNVATSGYTPNALNQFSSITTPGKLDVLARSDSPASFQIDGQNIAATRVGNLHNAHANVANSPNGKHVSVSVTANGSTQSGSRWLAPASVAPSYDADGNLKQDGRWSYTWDGEKRLTKLETLASAITAGAPNLTISYTYDFRSRKLRETLHEGSTLTQDERTLYDGWNPIVEFKGSAGVSPALSKTYLWGVDLSGTSQGAGGVGGLLAVRSATPVSGSSVFFPSYDTNGNIIAWSNESGQLIRRLDYDPFGNVVMKESFQGSTAELDGILKHGFSTKLQNPESGLLYYGYRFYDPQLGRWLNRDPIEEEGGVNLYGFVGNDAINLVDYLGNKFLWFNGDEIVEYLGKGYVNSGEIDWGAAGQKWSAVSGGTAGKPGLPDGWYKTNGLKALAGKADSLVIGNRSEASFTEKGVFFQGTMAAWDKKGYNTHPVEGYGLSQYGYDPKDAHDAAIGMPKNVEFKVGLTGAHGNNVNYSQGYRIHPKDLTTTSGCIGIQGYDLSVSFLKFIKANSGIELYVCGTIK